MFIAAVAGFGITSLLCGLATGVGMHVAAVASTVLLGYTLPTFVLPPIAERLALRFGAPTMVPIGLGIISLGLLLYFGCSASDPNWVSTFPGSLVAGAGLGLTNTPVTNTTTASVPESRSGAASGIDMTARLTFLAINIAVMGSLLVTGVAGSLREALPRVPENQLADLATQVVDGDEPASLVNAAPGPALGEPAEAVLEAVDPRDGRAGGVLFGIGQAIRSTPVARVAVSSPS
ncbi:hypothetical protein [Nocardia noduli]|uniref:hypothetical protein n=1 Tax=Nocardia noduli TaxID=2815722 RepID=UPI001C244CFF|nr:hypothetical protein [Nocardia noduli]